MRRYAVAVPLALLLLGSGGPKPTFQVELSPTAVTIASQTPGTFKITASVGEKPGELVLAVDVEGDGKPEFGSRLGSLFNDGLSGVYAHSCVEKGFVPEFESVALLPKGTTEGRPFVAISHFPDGNVRILLDADRDGVAEADAITKFVLSKPERAPKCVQVFPTPPSVPDPNEVAPDPG